MGFFGGRGEERKVARWVELGVSVFFFFGRTLAFDDLPCSFCPGDCPVLLVISSQRREVAPHWEYIFPAVTNCIGPSCGTQALKNVSYPAQVCGDGRAERCNAFVHPSIHPSVHPCVCDARRSSPSRAK